MCDRNRTGHSNNASELEVATRRDRERRLEGLDPAAALVYSIRVTHISTIRVPSNIRHLKIEKIGVQIRERENNLERVGYR